MSAKLCKSSLSFSHKNTVTKGTNLRLVKVVHRFLSLAQINKRYMSLT